MERPALQQLLAEIRSRRIDVVVVYKVDRLTRSLTDFARLVELFDEHGVSTPVGLREPLLTFHSLSESFLGSASLSDPSYWCGPGGALW